jgi:hypothetical protein
MLTAVPVMFPAERWAASDAEFAQKPSALPKEWQVGMDSNSTTGVFCQWHTGEFVAESLAVSQ